MKWYGKPRERIYRSPVTSTLPWVVTAQRWAFLGSSVVKNPTAGAEMWIQSLCWEDPLEEEMATHSSILAWKIPWTEEPGGLQSMGSQRVGHDLIIFLQKPSWDFFIAYWSPVPKRITTKTLEVAKSVKA